MSKAQYKILIIILSIFSVIAILLILIFRLIGVVSGTNIVFDGPVKDEVIVAVLNDHNVSPSGFYMVIGDLVGAGRAGSEDVVEAVKLHRDTMINSFKSRIDNAPHRLQAELSRRQIDFFSDPDLQSSIAQQIYRYESGLVLAQEIKDGKPINYAVKVNISPFGLKARSIERDDRVYKVSAQWPSAEEYKINSFDPMKYSPAQLYSRVLEITQTN